MTGGCSLMCRRIWILLCKNLLLRRTHFMITGFDILLPIVCALIMVSSKSALPKAHSVYRPATEFPVISENVSYFGNCFLFLSAKLYDSNIISNC